MRDEGGQRAPRGEGTGRGAAAAAAPGCRAPGPRSYRLQAARAIGLMAYRGCGRRWAAGRPRRASLHRSVGHYERARGEKPWQVRSCSWGQKQKSASLSQGQTVSRGGEQGVLESGVSTGTAARPPPRPRRAARPSAHVRRGQGQRASRREAAPEDGAARNFNCSAHARDGPAQGVLAATRAPGMRR